jgi:hypothetical protein
MTGKGFGFLVLAGLAALGACAPPTRVFGSGGASGTTSSSTAGPGGAGGTAGTGGDASVPDATPPDAPADSGDAGCPTGQTACDGTCVDEQTDDANCGGCGLACSTGCSAGRCLVTLASGQTGMLGIVAIDATNIYWGLNSTSNGMILSVPIAGGTVTTIASGQAGPWGLASTGSLIYWANSNPVGSSVASIVSSITPPFSPSPYTNASGFMGNPGPIAVDSTSVYFTDINGGSTYIMKAPAQTSGSAVTLSPGTTEMFGCATDSSFVYFTNYGGGTIQKVSVNGGTPTTIATGQNLPFWIAVDGTNAYWATLGGAIGMVDKNGVNGAKNLASGQAASGYLAIDASYVYWTNSHCATDAGPCPSVMKVPIAGGTPTTLASSQPGPSGIAVDATSVYWADTTAGTIMKLTPK